MADEEGEKERVDRELKELLEELRVAIPGVQVLGAFLLTVAFTQRIFEATQLQRNVYFAELLLTSMATCLLIAPTAYHRLNFRADTEAKKHMLFTCTHFAVAGLALLLAALTGAVFLVGDVLYATWVAAVVAVGVGLWFGWFWFMLPLNRRARMRNGRKSVAVRSVRRVGGRPA